MKSVALASLLIVLGCGIATADPVAGKKKSKLCVSCHVAATDRPFLPLLDGQPREYIAEQIQAFKTRQRPIEAMAQNADHLSATDIRDLADYFSPRTPARSPMLDMSRASAGTSKLRQLHCGTCHLPTYTGQGVVARLAGQNPKYTAWTLDAMIRGQRRHPAAAAAELKALSSDDIDLIAQALASK
jgi:cytochrome c553